MSDCLADMLNDFRRRPMPLFDADRRDLWFDAVADLLAAPTFTEAQRFAWVATLANDVSCQWGVPINLAAKPILDRLIARGVEFYQP